MNVVVFFALVLAAVAAAVFGAVKAGEIDSRRMAARRADAPEATNTTDD